MNYIKITPEEQGKLLKRIEEIQKEQTETFNSCTEVITQWESKVIPWYYRIYMMFTVNHKYSIEESRYQLAMFTRDFSCNTRAFSNVGLDIMNSHGKPIYIPCEVYRNIIGGKLTNELLKEAEEII